MMNKASVVCVMLLLSACAETGDPEDGDQVVAMERRGDPDDPPPDDPPECDDGNECTVEWFANGRCRTRRLSDWTECSDGDACNGPEYCRAGSCLNNGQPMQCDDGNSCTDESCDPGSGFCVYTDSTASCSDGSSCTVADACEQGVCVGLGSTSGEVSVPTISAVEASAPLPSKVLARGSNYYLAGDTFDLELTVASCSYVTGVQIGAAMLTTAPRLACGEFEDVPDCEPRFYTIESDTLFADGSRRLQIRLHLRPGTGDGRGTAASVIVSSALGDTAFDFTIARVAEIQPATIGVTVSESDLHNAFIAGIYQRFGDAGQLPDPADPTRIIAYNPDYGSTYVDVTESGLRVGLEFEADPDSTCDPQVHVDALYLLSREGSVIRAIRVLNEADVRIDIDWECEYFPLLGLITAFARGLAEDTVLDTMDGIAQSIADGLCGMSCDNLAVSTANGEVRLQTLNAFESVAIDLPYEARWSRFPETYGLPVAAGETLVVTAQNTGVGCDTAVWPGQPCFGAGMGPRGVPNLSAAPGTAGELPVPNPSELVDGSWRYFPERAEARAVLRVLTRSPSSLPRPDQPVGRLLAGLLSRGAAPPLVVGTGPCQIVTSTDDLLGLGPNDRTTTDGRVVGTGVRRINVLFNPPIAGLPTCD